MTRREFSRSVKIEVLKRAGASGFLICEVCSSYAKRWQIDHRVADSHGGEPTLENAQLICEICFREKNAKDTTVAAQLKRQETAHLGVNRPRSKGFSKPERERTKSTKILPFKRLFVDTS